MSRPRPTAGRLPTLRPLSSVCRVARIRQAVAVLVPLTALASAGPLRAQYDAPPRPAAWALEGVTVVGADGRRTEDVTVVVRGGLLATLSQGAPVPADARRLAGEGLFVYPGLVDGQGFARVSFSEEPGRPDDEEVVSWDPPRARSGFVPHRRVAEHLAVAGEGVSSTVRDGVVAALVHPEGGLAPGQPAVLVLRPDARTPRDLVAVPSAGLDLSLRSARGVYPSQLFGVMAYLRQAFLDAGHWATARAAYARDPAGLVSPAWDADYEVLRAAAAGEMPVWFRADRDEDIRRVLGLADEVGFRPVIVGGEEAWKLAGELAEREIPVLISMNLPRPRTWSEEDSLSAPLSPAAQREKTRIEAARANAGRLERAGVTFALTSGGGVGDLLEGARTAIRYGLSPDGALRALTTTPAALLGIPALARVEEGLAATFLVTDGDLFDEDTGVVYAFVDGRLVEGTRGGGESGDETRGRRVGRGGAR